MFRFERTNEVKEVERRFDPDKRITVTNNASNTNTGFDPDKRMFESEVSKEWNKISEEIRKNGFIDIIEYRKKYQSERGEG